ncbi:MAG: hypothetical protein JJU02_05545, partial [Cryomorphaceae bacterium]|nr:hypothetical protein [Cryomorphaceae bacterium]
MALKKISKKRSTKSIPDKEGWTLPNGMAWEDHHADLTAHGVTFWQNQIWVMTPVGKGRNKNKVVHTYSDFIVNILQHIVDISNPIKIVELENTSGHKVIFDCPADRFVDMGNFKKTVERQGAFIWEGSEVHYAKLKKYLYNKMGFGRKIEVLGWQGEGFWCWNNGIFVPGKNEFIPTDQNGCVKFKQTTFYLPSANPIYADSDSDFIPQKKVICIEPKISFEDFMAQFYRVHREHAITGILYMICAAFSDFIFEQHDQVPILFLYGPASSGKNHISKCLKSFFGAPQQAMGLTGKANTDKGKIRKFAMFKNLLVELAEYRNQYVTGEVEEAIKALADRVGYERGTMAAKYSSEHVPISCCAIITSNDYPTNNEMISRMLIEEVSQNKFSIEDKEEFSKLQKMLEKGYSGFLHEILQRRKEFCSKYPVIFQEHSKTISSILRDANVEERMIRNPTILYVIYRFFRNKIEFPFSDEQVKEHLKNVISLQNEKRETGSDITKFWDVFLHACKLGKVVNNRDFKVDGNLIYIQFAFVFQQYLETHRHLHGKPGFSKTTLLDKLKVHVSFVEYKKVRIDNGTPWTLIFNMDKISEDFEDSV